MMALPVVLNHYVLPEIMDGTFKVKCKHCSKVISGFTKQGYYLPLVFPLHQPHVERLFSVAGKVFRPDRC